MKILLVSRWFWEERRRNGGQPGFCGELVEALVQKGVDLTILSQSNEAGLDPEPQTLGHLKVHLFSREKRKPGCWLPDKLLKPWSGYRKVATDAATIRQFVSRHGPFDAIIAQSEEPDGLACAWAFRTGAWPPLLTQVHDLRYKFGEGAVRFTHRTSLGFVFKKSDRVVANSEQTARWIEREYGVPAQKIGQCRIHLTAPFLQNARSTVRSEERVLFLGALNRKKAPDIFLRAAALLAPQMPGATFVLTGSETSDDLGFRAELKKFQDDPRLAGRIELTGRLNAVAVAEQIGRARVVVCPSRVETFSRTTVEALALDRPVIVSETTGAAHWIDATGAGAVVPPEDPVALAAAIRDWMARAEIPSTEQVRTELTAVRAADDLLCQVELTSPRSRA